MKIGLDVRMFDYSGIGVTIKKLLENLSPEQRDQLVLFSAKDWVNPHAEGKVVPAPYSVYGLKQHVNYPFVLRKHKLNLFHMPHYDVPYTYGRPFVATVHDIIHYLFPQFSTKPLSRTYSKAMLAHTAKRAKKIITVSENTKKDLETHFPKAAGKVQVIYPAVDPQFRPMSNENVRAVLSKYSLLPNYFLYVGNLRESKNTPALINAYAALKKQHPDAPPLVLVGKTFLKDLGAVPNDVFHIENATTEELPAFYSGAALFVFPSLYEGFGLPPLEAMACGAPVLSSRAASLTEVCGNAAHYIDPLSQSELVDGMWSLITSPSKRDDMKKKGLDNVKRFSWKRFAASTWQVYNESIA